jgi:hypothetical protein
LNEGDDAIAVFDDDVQFIGDKETVTMQSIKSIEVGADKIKGMSEHTCTMKALFFQKALASKTNKAMKALREEVMKTIKIDT